MDVPIVSRVRAVFDWIPGLETTARRPHAPLVENPRYIGRLRIVHYGVEDLVAKIGIEVEAPTGEIPHVEGAKLPVAPKHGRVHIVGVQVDAVVLGLVFEDEVVNVIIPVVMGGIGLGIPARAGVSYALLL